MDSLTSIIPAALTPFVKKINLEWPIIFDIDIFCQEAYIIATPPNQQLHMFRISPKTVSDYRPVLPLLTKGLCRAKLGELLDPIFVIIIWEPGGPKQTSPITIGIIRAVVNQILGVWANDLRQTHWPKLSQQELVLFAKIIQQWEPGMLRKFMDRPQGIIEIAGTLAMAIRHKQNSSLLRSLFARLENNQKQKLTQLENFLASLPQLNTGNLDAAIHQLEENVTNFLVIVDDSIHVKIECNQNGYYWKILD